MKHRIEQLPGSLPDQGIGENEAYALFSAIVTEGSARLDAADFLAHMDPPTPKIASQLVGLNAQFNQNLLHPDLSPVATIAEQIVVSWLASHFGMADGHMCSGSTLANLTALWAAREAGVKNIVTSKDAHISVEKSASILGLPLILVPTDSQGRLDTSQLPDVSSSALVLTAGTTGRGVIDHLARYQSAWLHIDAAWAGPLILTRHAALLDGIEHADSIAISAHKWFYQPKDSALVFFADSTSQNKMSFSGSYLARPNTGIQGSRSAAAIPLLASLMAWGKTGLAERIETNMQMAEDLAEILEREDHIDLKQWPETAVINWRPKLVSFDDAKQRLGSTSSQTIIDETPWFRQVAANPNADISIIAEKIRMSAQER